MAKSASQAIDPVFLMRRTHLTRFIVISAIIHLIAVVIHGITPAKLSDPEVKPQIKVHYIQPEELKPEKKKSVLIDAPEPAKAEKPRSSELLASHDSRAHAGKKTSTKKQYQAKKTVVPKFTGQPAPRPAPREQPVSRPVTKPAPQQTPVEKSPMFPLADKGFISEEKKPVQPAPPVTEPNVKSGSAMALLDGFDASKYASIDTNASVDEEDDEVISLDTKETKYASYFARIKHQIQRVWDYPEEAARRGISGELTLRFQIQRDGDLMDVRLIEGSGSELLDFAAIRAIKNAAPFYPFPVTIERNKISILATFIYSPTYGASRKF